MTEGKVTIAELVKRLNEARVFHETPVGNELAFILVDEWEEVEADEYGDSQLTTFEKANVAVSTYATSQRTLRDEWDEWKEGEPARTQQKQEALERAEKMIARQEKVAEIKKTLSAEGYTESQIGTGLMLVGNNLDIVMVRKEAEEVKQRALQAEQKHQQVLQDRVDKAQQYRQEQLERHEREQQEANKWLEQANAKLVDERERRAKEKAERDKLAAAESAAFFEAVRVRKAEVERQRQAEIDAKQAAVDAINLDNYCTLTQLSEMLQLDNVGRAYSYVAKYGYALQAIMNPASVNPEPGVAFSPELMVITIEEANAIVQGEAIERENREKRDEIERQRQAAADKELEDKRKTLQELRESAERDKLLTNKERRARAVAGLVRSGKVNPDQARSWSEVESEMPDLPDE